MLSIRLNRYGMRAFLRVGTAAVFSGNTRNWRIVREKPNSKYRRDRRLAMPAALVGFLVLTGSPLSARAQDAGPATTAGQAASSAKSVGTVKSVAGRNITLEPESGGEMTVIVQDAARVVRAEPGSTDLKNAAPLALEDLQPGDRILVRGKAGDNGKSLLAVSV